MLNPGQRIAHLEVLEQLGAGGMGVVYKARDLQLDRIVALKVLAAGRADDEAMQSRLLREARAASALNHPNIVTIHEAGSEQGVHYIVMEFLEGVTLADRIPPAGMPVADAIAVAQAIAAALAAAHAAGIVHRDLKPANVMVRPDGTVKVMDFGLAKALLPPTGEADATRTVGDTAAGVVLGTGPYMSPEQAEGKAVDARSDIFSFGAMFYEMLTGRRAFLGDTLISTISSVLKETPPSIHSLRGEVEPALERVVNRCLQKDREGRYPSGAELAAALSPMTAQPAPAGSRRAKVATAAAVMAALAVAAAWWGIGQRRAQRVRNTTVPEIYRLRADMQYLAAFQLAMQARQILPADPAVEQAVISCCPIFPIHSQPPGARIYYRPYLEPNAPEQLLGQTPANFPLPLAIIRVRVVKEGYEDAEGTIEPRPGLEFVLEPKGTRPPGMVTVPAGIQSWNGNPVQLAPYWLDKYEVSNRKFKEFVDQGGYRKREYWKHPFVKDGREIPWEDALRLMVDSTGRPGPATWELGSYAEGRGDYPVGGVSWYEAAAYAEFAGKSLPTVAHWRRAAAFGQFSEILRLSNFGQGPAPVGKFPGIGPFGTFDMAGNVSEWCFNATSNARRAALGGSWQEASYRFRDFDARDPMERLPIYGFRCAKYREAPPESAFQPAQKPARDPSKETPASDEVFNSWRTSYAYDKTPLDAKVESVDDSAEYYRKEKISFLTAYGGERIQALLLLPKNARPPYQTVVYYPSGDAVFSRDSSVIGTQRHLQYFPRSGRALLHPIYQGTYERIKAPPDGPNAVRELVVQRSQDMRRAIDYLETRSDIDSGKLAFHGISMGCREGTVAVALEPRFRTAILAYCGIPDVRYPGIDPLDFVPRIKIPVLLLEGREDFTFPYETSQLPMFHLLGSPASDKKLVVRDGGHIVALSPEIVRQNLDWLDHYLGPVK